MEEPPNRDIGTSERPKIFVSTYLPPSTVGGVERVVKTLLTFLEEDGWHVRVVTSNQNSALEARIRPFSAWRIGRRIKKSADIGDLIICNNYFSWNTPKERSLVIFHGTEIGRALSTRMVYSRFRNLAVRIVNSRLDRMTGTGRTVIAVSNSTKEEVEKHYKTSVDYVIPNAVDTTLFKPARDKLQFRRKYGLPDEFLVLCIGSGGARKGSEIIKRTIIPGLKGRQHIVMVGEMMDVPEGVTALGSIPFDSMNEVYKACDAFIMPSYYEGCGLATIEALASGLPSVVSPTGVGKDIMNDVILSEYVVPCSEPERYLICLRRLQESRNEWLKISEASREFAVKFHDINDFRERYLAVIHSIGDRSNTRPR